MLYEEFGEALFSGFAGVERKVRDRLGEWARTASEEGDVGAAVPVLKEARRKKLLDARTWARDGKFVEIAAALWKELGEEVFHDYAEFEERAGTAMGHLGLSLTAADRKTMLRAVSWRDESAEPVVLKRHKSGTEARPMYGLYEVTGIGGVTGANRAIVEYEPDSELRDTEQIPLLENGGIEAFFQREVLPYAADAWIKESATKVGYEVSFTRHFYTPPVLRSLEEIRADIMILEQETEGLLGDIFRGGAK